MNKFITLLGAIIIGAGLTAAVVTTVHSTQTVDWMQKVEPSLLEASADGVESEFLLYLSEQADLSKAASFPTKLEKGSYVFEQLTAVAQRTQPLLIDSLNLLGVEYRPFWIANMIWVRGDAALIKAMAQRQDVAHIYANPAVFQPTPPKIGYDYLPNALLSVEWNINLINAPDAWSAGYYGQGIVIGGQDTGYDWSHPALINQYRGWNGITATHDYNWHDAIHTSGSPCIADSPEPCDDNSHGTHTMGTMVGDDGSINQIGVAPRAKWIGCRNMKLGWGTPATYAECYQWFIAPTDLNNQNPDPSKAPHVINNSWSCPPVEGCVDPNALLVVVENVRAAGIVTVHSAGNEGPSCESVQNPAAIYDASFTVGATSINDSIASFSSRGPVSRDGSYRPKPDISAPGVGIRSSIPGNGYGYKNGTSMAGPQVAGLVALLLSAQPAMVGDVDAIENSIQQTAVPLTTAQGCGGDDISDVPNHVYGYGRIDANKHGLTLDVFTSLSSTYPGGLITYTFTVNHYHLFTYTNHVVLTDRIPSGTTFITATQPFALKNSVVQWEINSLASNSPWQVDLVIQVPMTYPSSMVTNFDYRVRSDEVITPVSGGAILTSVGSRYTYYFPVFIESE